MSQRTRETDSHSARQLAAEGFDGYAIGGLVPRVRDKNLIQTVVEAVREEVGDAPLHVFGLGHPAMVRDLWSWGVDSVDSSSYVRRAVDGRDWEGPVAGFPEEPTPWDRVRLAMQNLAELTRPRLPPNVYGTRACG